jgi:hypothetical protein
MLLANQTRAAIGNLIDDEVNAGAGTSQAKFQNTAQTATYATCDLSATAFGSATASGTITLAGTPSETNASAGTATRCGFYDGSAVLVFTLGVNDTGTPDMSISNNQFQAGDQVDITSLTISVPAGSVVTT